MKWMDTPLKMLEMQRGEIYSVPNGNDGETFVKAEKNSEDTEEG